jgi:hemolysin activation/secretion protein
LRIISVGLTAFLFAASPAFAQGAPALPSRQELQPGQVLSPTMAPRDPSGLFEQLPGGPCPFLGSDLSFSLRSIEFSGLPPEWERIVRDAWSDRVGQSISVAELCTIRDDVARALLARNLLARVEIPEQKITDGIVRLDVVPGRFEEVRVTGNAPATALVRKTLEPITQADRIDLDVVQRYLLLAADIPGVVLTPTVLPGTARGGLVLEVAVDRRPITFSLGGQNFNSRTQGRITGVARLSIEGLTGHGDRTTLLASTSSDFRELQVYQIGQEYRIGSEGLTVRGSFTYAIGRPGDVLTPLDLRSRSLVGNLELSYPLVRHRRRNLNLAGGIDLIDQRTRVFETLPLSREQARVAYVRASGNVSSRYGDDPAALSVAVELRQGLDILGATEQGSFDLTRPFVDPQATLVRANLGAKYSPARNISFIANGFAQYTGSALVTYEQMGIGNLSIGRGYDPNAAPGDRGAALALEVEFGPIARAEGLVAPFVFFDAARVTNLGPRGYSDTLRSVGGGVRGNIANRVDFGLTYAHPLDPAFPGGPRADDRVLVTLSATFL